jgi:hypothetical protein
MSEFTLAPLTQKARASAIAHLLSELAKSGTPRTLEDMTVEDVERYLVAQRDNGMSLRTLQNRIAHYRAVLRAIGRYQLVLSLNRSSRDLGISSACRDGRHRPISQREYEDVIQRAQRMDTGFACALQLQRELGLKSTEAILCGPSLREWARDLQIRDRVRVTEGTRKNDHREAIANDPQKALQAVQAAIAAAKANGGALIPSKSIAGAARAYGRLCEKVGLVGVYASEVLRIMYVQERYRLNFDRLGRRREALAATCLDIGHSEVRIRHIEKVFQL